MTTNKIYHTPGTPVTFMNTGGDVVLTLKNMASGKARVSNQWDRGAGALPAIFKIETCLKFAGAVTIGNVCRVYLYGAQAGSALVDQAADAELAAETLLHNFDLVDVLKASANSVGPFYRSCVAEIIGRYVNVAVWNASGQTIDNADGTSYIKITPFAPDIQAAS